MLITCKRLTDLVRHHRCHLAHGRSHGMTPAALANRAQSPPINRGQQRVYVAATPEILGLCRLFVSHLEAYGHGAPPIVGTLEEAFKLLDIDDCQFEPVSLYGVDPGGRPLQRA